jgi:hypothetical protein
MPINSKTMPLTYLCHRPCSKPDAFAGVHSQVGLIVSFDEASGIDDTIYDVTAGFFTDLSPLRIWILIPNGRKNTGEFTLPKGKYRTIATKACYINTHNQRLIAMVLSLHFSRIGVFY